ncbi:MAG: hypothetical protein L0Z55_03745 [Planctomycetes bacterium]|nr:hypothetical protein [Planctomycetota bacterium]
MGPRLFEIHLCTVPLRGNIDRRPWLVVAAGPSKTDRFISIPISSQLDLYDEVAHFLLEQSDPDFPATGLVRTSYVIANNPVAIHANRFVRRLGHLGGELRERFELWNSMP